MLSELVLNQTSPTGITNLITRKDLFTRCRGDVCKSTKRYFVEMLPFNFKRDEEYRISNDFFVYFLTSAAPYQISVARL